MDLVIMAAGMGSRFGGLKQVEPIDEYNNFIIDYSIFDAIKAGFDRVVFIIKEENYQLFKSTVGARIENHIKVDYVFQGGLDALKTRTKPWGTGHAILCCKDVVKENFAIINADDFYGRDAFIKAASYARGLDKNSTDFAIVGYKVKNTLSENGAAKRGICYTKNGYLEDILESSIERVSGQIIAKPLNEDRMFNVDENQEVSMNMFCFTPRLFKFLEEGLEKFLEENKNDLTKCEYLLPDVVQKLIKQKLITVKVLDTSAVWYGVTYKEDKPAVVKSIKKLVDNGDYKKGLWNKR